MVVGAGSLLCSRPGSKCRNYCSQCKEDIGGGRAGNQSKSFFPCFLLPLIIVLSKNY